MKIKVKSHVETQRKIGYRNGLEKAISLLENTKKMILVHRSHCKEWAKLGTTQDSNRIYCMDCHVGSISKIIEPMIFRLSSIIYESKYDGDIE
jgi:hypothetical protein